MAKFSLSAAVAAVAMSLCAGAYAAGGVPPQIPHDISAYKITPEMNPCVMCHGDKTKSGAAKVAGSPQAMPADHFAKAAAVFPLRLFCAPRFAPLRTIPSLSSSQPLHHVGFPIDLTRPCH